jgi:hypothetical protein
VLGQHRQEIAEPPRSALPGDQSGDQVDDGALFFSVISLAEICKGIAKLPSSKKRA